MQPKYPGLYLYFDWLNALEKLPPETAMKIIGNLHRFAEFDQEPEPLEGMESLIQSFMLSQLRRAKKSSESNKRTYQEKKQRSVRLISEQIPREELDREATEEEIRLFGAAMQKHRDQELSNEVKRVLARARETCRGLNNP